MLAPVRDFVGEESQGEGGPDLTAAVSKALECFGRLAAAGSGIADTPANVAARLRMASEFLNLRAVLGRIEISKVPAHADSLRALSQDLGNTYQFGALPAHSVARRLLALMEAVGDRVGLANTLRSLGDLEFLLGRNSEAR
ncbi:MAG: hypothetical protein JST93_31865, partial [Acidobacteria bacterium]|nr:hypothetical protein [Acidobacteriota bacterium]